MRVDSRESGGVTDFFTTDLAATGGFAAEANFTRWVGNRNMAGIVGGTLGVGSFTQLVEQHGAGDVAGSVAGRPTGLGDQVDCPHGTDEEHIDLLQAETHPVLVQLFVAGQAPLRVLEQVSGRIEHFGVEDDLEAEEDIVGAEGLAVGPLMSFTKVEGQLSEVIIPFPILSNVWNDGLEIIRIPY